MLNKWWYALKLDSNQKKLLLFYDKYEYYHRNDDHYYFIFYDGNIKLIKHKATTVVINCLSTKKLFTFWIEMCIINLCLKY